MEDRLDARRRSKFDWDRDLRPMTRPRHMMATTAYHLLGDISRDPADLCYVSKEDDAHFVGAWQTGFGFVDVRFPKETTRELTDAEVAHFETLVLNIGGVSLPIKITR